VDESRLAIRLRERSLKERHHACVESSCERTSGGETHPSEPATRLQEVRVSPPGVLATRYGQLTRPRYR
jgi:hypothetical protein